MNTKNNIYQIRSDTWVRGSIEQDLNAIGGIIMAYDLGINIYSEFMLFKNDRIKNANEYFRNTDYNKHLRHIVKATLLEPAAPMGIRLIIDMFEAYLQSSGFSILLKDE